MFLTATTALFIFLIGELLCNLTVFRYMKSYFIEASINQETTIEEKPRFLGLSLSVFKGMLERFFLFTGLHFGFTPVLVVFEL